MCPLPDGDCDSPRILFLAAPNPNCTLNASQSQPQPHSLGKLLPPQTQWDGASDWLSAPVYRGSGPMTGRVTSCGHGGRVSCMQQWPCVGPGAAAQWPGFRRAIASLARVSPETRARPRPRGSRPPRPPHTLSAFFSPSSFSPNTNKCEKCKVKSEWIIVLKSLLFKLNRQMLNSDYH